MQAAGNAVLVLILLQNLVFLGSGRLRTIIQAVAAQGVVLSTLPLLLYGALGRREVAVSAGALVLKGVVIPRMLMRALADLPIRREIEPTLGFKSSLLTGAAATVGSIWLATLLPLVSIGGASTRLTVAASFATVLTGF